MTVRSTAATAVSILWMMSMPVAAIAAPADSLTVLMQALAAGPSTEGSFQATGLSTIPFNQTVASSGTGTGLATATVSKSNGNLLLQAYASAVSPNVLQGESFGNIDVFFNDTFYIGGTGTQQFQYTLNLGALASGSYWGATDSDFSARGTLGLEENSTLTGWGTIRQDNDFCSSSCPNGQIASVEVQANRYNASASGGTYTGYLNLSGGETIELGLYLSIRDLAVGGQATYDLGDGAYMTLTPVTPGASFTTASGLTYASAPDAAPVPEPGSVVLIATALCGLASTARRRANHATARCAAGSRHHPTSA